MRRLSYRHAVTALFFTSCWLVLGFLFLTTPVPDALGVTGQMIGAWIALFFLFLAVSGSMLTMASINGIWPPGGHTGGRVPARVRTTTSTPPGHDPSAQAWTRPLPPRSGGR